MRSIRRNARRGLNVAARLRAGLPPRPESVTPEAPTDLYQAHLSIYRFFARFTAGRRVLDLGCGSGQGSRELIESGARAVLGLDIDARSIRYARRRFAAPGLSFEVANAEALPAGLGEFDVVVSSNMFEHLSDPAAALERVTSLLEPGGTFVLAVPPIYDERSRAVTERGRHHRSNRPIEAWLTDLRSRFGEVSQFAHMPREGAEPDMDSPFPSRLGPGDFRFDPVGPGIAAARTLTAIFVAAGPRAGSAVSR